MAIRFAPRHLRLALAVAGLATLAACASPFEARVQSFQSMPPAQGQTFVLKPADSSLPASLEFQSYSNLVSAELQRLGFRPAAADSAELHVLLNFGAGPGRERIATRPGMTPHWSWHGRGWYGPGPMWRSSFYDPFWGSSWNQPDVYSFTVYPAFVEVDILRAADQAPLFEGRAETTTRVNDLPATMPQLVTALFTDFPGDPARSKVVRVNTAKQPN